MLDDSDDNRLNDSVEEHLQAALLPSPPAYPPPLDQLLTLGESEVAFALDPRAAALNVQPHQIPDLIRMVRDATLYAGDPSAPETWAVDHALYLLPTFDLHAYIPDLMPLLDLEGDSFTDTVPEILARGGKAAVQPLMAYVQDETRWNYGRSAASGALVKLATLHPELRSDVIATIAGVVAKAATNPITLNGFLTSDLLELKAVEALPVIRQVYEQDRIEDFFFGGWTDVLQALDLPVDPTDALVILDRAQKRADAEARRQRSQPLPQFDAPARTPSKKKKQARKTAAASRKANRPKKKKKR